MKHTVFGILLAAVGIFSCLAVHGEEPGNSPAARALWKHEMTGQLNLTQNRFDNWSQGGEESLTWQFGLRGKTTLKTVTRQWTNTLKLGYGETQTGSQSFRKSTDEIKVESVFSWPLAAYLNPYLGVKGETQIAPGYTYAGDSRTEISRFLDPGFFTESIGFGFASDPVIETRIGFALKETVTRDFPIPYADDPSTEEVEKIKVEPGLESTSELTLKLTDILLFTSKLEIFSNLKSSDQIDVRWDSTCTAGISKFVNAQLNVELFYDRDISVRRQLKQVLSLGLVYSLF